MGKGLPRTLKRAGVTKNLGYTTDYAIDTTITWQETPNAAMGSPAVSVAFATPEDLRHFEDQPKEVISAALRVNEISLDGALNIPGTNFLTVAVGTKDVLSSTETSLGVWVNDGFRDIFTDQGAYSFNSFPSQGYADNVLQTPGFQIAANNLTPFYLNIALLFGSTGWLNQDLRIRANIHVVYKLI